MSKRVVFTFDDRSYEDLVKLVKEGKYPSLAAAVRDALAVKSFLVSQKQQGFDELVVRNPRSEKERVMVSSGA